MPIVRPTLSFLAERGVRDGSSREETFAPDNAVGRQKFWVPWASRYDGAKAIVGYSQIARVGGAPDRLERLPPLPYWPYVGGAPLPDEVKNWRAKEVVSVRGFKWTGAAQSPAEYGGGWQATYDKAELEVSYAPVPYSCAVDDDVNLAFEFKRFFWQETTRPSASFISMPTGVLKYTQILDNKAVVPYGTTVIEPMEEIKWRWVNLPYDILKLNEPWRQRLMSGDGSSGDLSYIGCINKELWPQIDDGGGYPKGSLLLTEWEPVIKMNALGMMSVDVIFTTLFTPRPGGHNALWYNDPTGSLSGYYYVSRENPAVYRSPGTVPRNGSLYNEVKFSNLTRVYATDTP